MSSTTGGSDGSKSGSIDDADVVTKLYRRTCLHCHESDRWSKFKDPDAEEQALDHAIASDPIIHRYSDRRGKWVTKSFTIQSSPMRAHVRAALEKYQDFDPDLEEWTFRYPFKPLVHRWDRLLELVNADDQGQEAKETIQQLMTFLRPILAGSVKALSRTKETGRIVFNDIWQIFPPNELVITTFYGVEAICRVTRYERPEGADCWVIHLEFVNWNGERSGYDRTTVNITSFRGNKHVDSLPVYPLSFNTSATELKERIVQRGRLFEKLRGYHFRICKGTKILLPEMNEERRVSGRVIIDTYAYYLTINKPRPHLRPLGSDEKPENLKLSRQDSNHSDDEFNNSEEESDRGSHIERPRPRYKHDPRSTVPRHDPRVIPPPPHYMPHNQRARPFPTPIPGSLGTGHPVSRRPPHWGDPPNTTPRREGGEMSIKKAATKPFERSEMLEPLTDLQCLLATPWVTGLDLKNKDWAQFRVDNLSDIPWNDESFENLILPGNEKELSWALVENKALAGDTFDDFVEDKGRGIIILMFGPPGVGKTYTAEAVAERARVPLYNVSAARLGKEPSEVEIALDQALDLCKLWNAMLLLDEADVFLNARSNVNLTQNELVAVFLTKLEYYQGICFMATNRMGSLDHAIQSRVDLFLHYADLTVTARRQVWENFFLKTGRSRFAISEAELDVLAEFKLNGREIKNLVKTAHLLSVKDMSKGIGMDKLTMLVNNRLQALATLEEQ